MGTVESNCTAGPLSGVRVVDMTINVLGPVATQILGDMGAEVIKIEPPGGDPMRDSGEGRSPRMSAFFLNMNRNKRSVVLDLKSEAGREALLRLAETSDVLVHSMRPAAAVRLGLAYGDISKRFPRLIYACATGYDPYGPLKDQPAYDDVIQGESGLADMVFRATGTAGYLPTVVADKTCGVYLASAIGMALYCRERTGKGQEVVVPMLESMLSFNLVEHLTSGAFGDSESIGYRRALSKHRRPYQTQDGYMCVLAVNDQQWRRLLTALGLASVMEDPRFSTMSERSKNIDRLYEILADAISTRTTQELKGLLSDADIPHGAVRKLSELLEDDYLRETGFFQTYEHPTEGTVLTTKIPQIFSETPPTFRLPPPRLGQHTGSVLKELGYSDAEIRQLEKRAAGAAFVAGV